MASGGSTGLIGSVTRGDILGCLRCVVAFAPLLLAPGYCVAWMCNLLGFRERPLGQRLAWAVAVSFSIVPVAAVELAKCASLTAVCWVAALFAVAAAVLLAQDLRAFANRHAGWAAGFAAVWIGFVVLELVDVAVGNRLYLSATIYDNALRTAFVDAVLHTGVPPTNPLYWPGHAASMRYYYFWYVLTAGAARLGHATARQAIIASAVWAGFGLAAILALYCRHFLSNAEPEPSPRSNGKTRPRTALALALLVVTGLDLIPVLAKVLFQFPIDADMEWWSRDLVTSWIDSLLWVPHHIAGLLCCLFGFLAVWMSKGLGRRQQCLCAVVAGLAFASAFGLSTWVAVAFALVMVTWILWVLRWEHDSRGRVPVLVGAGLVAAVALAPFVLQLRDAAHVTGAQGDSVANNASHLLQFAIRQMIEPETLQIFPWVAHLARAYPRTEEAVASLFLLFPGYFVELGFYGFVLIAALAAVRRLKLNEATRTTLVLAIAGLLVATFLRSSVIQNNDFGFRSILVAQFFLLLLAVRWFEGAFEPTRRGLRTAMTAMLWLGVAGSVYQAINLRLYLPEQEKLGRPDQAGLSERAMAWRQGFDAMDRAIPQSAVVQFNTAQPSDFFRFAQVLQVRRQVVTAFPTCASAFGGDPAACPGIQASVARLFSSPPQATLSATAARAECSQMGAQYLIATRWDSAWDSPAGWVWTLPAAADTGNMRVLRCDDR